MKGFELSMMFQALLAVIVIGVMMLGTYSFVQRGEFDVIKPIKEFFGFLVGGTTMGQMLSVPMVMFGLFCIWRAKRLAPAA